jgi:hypothetical protein
VVHGSCSSRWTAQPAPLVLVLPKGLVPLKWATRVCLGSVTEWDVTDRHQIMRAGRGFLEYQPSSAESGEFGMNNTGDPVLTESLRMSKGVHLGLRTQQSLLFPACTYYIVIEP